MEDELKDFIDKDIKKESQDKKDINTISIFASHILERIIDYDLKLKVLEITIASIITTNTNSFDDRLRIIRVAKGLITRLEKEVNQDG